MCEVGGDGGTCSPSENSRPPSKEKNLSWGDAKTSTPMIGTVKSLMFFIRGACGYGLRRYFPAYLEAIMVSFAN